MSKNYYSEQYIPSIVKWGKLTLGFGIILSFAPIVVISFVLGYMPPISAIIGGAFAQISAYAVLYVVEPVSYYPILGIPGTYLSFLAGNLGNMRVPCAMIAQESAGVEPGTDKGSIISTIGIAISVIVNVVILTLGVLLGTSILSLLPQSVQDALNLILPALFGAVFGQFAITNIKLGAISALIAVVMTFLVKAGYLSFLPGNPVYVIIIASVFGTILIGKKLFEKEESKNNA